MSDFPTRTCLGYGVLTVSNTAVDLNDATPAIDNLGSSNCSRAIITIEDDAIRWRADDTAPTATEGSKFDKDMIFTLMDADYYHFLRDIKFIRVTTDAKLKIAYFD